MKSKLLIFLLFGLAGVSTSAMSLTKSDTKIRAYCYYLKPGEKVVADKLNPVLREKLVHKNEDGSLSQKSINFDARTHRDHYVIDEGNFYEIFNLCQSQIGEKGHVVDIQATSKRNYETVELKLYGTSPVKVEANGKVSDLKAYQIFPMAEIAKKQEQAKVKKRVAELDDFFKENKDDLRQLVEELNDEALLDWVQKSGRELTDTAQKNALKALIISGTIASFWLSGPYLAVATRELYPVIYKLIFGSVPAKYTFEYLLVYLPGLEHASAFAYNNSQAILAGIYGGAIATYKITGVAYQGVVRFSQATKDALIAVGTGVSDLYHGHQSESGSVQKEEKVYVPSRSELEARENIRAINRKKIQDNLDRGYDPFGLVKI